jgi:hypothetical protein
MDMVSTPSIEVAEGHHLAWCIGRVCSVRPGSIAPSRLGGKTEKKLFLTWRDIVLTRGDKKGNCRVEITFRSLKTTLEDPDTALNTNKRQESLQCNVMPPQATETLIFSIPHRLLVIALRRGILAGIDSLDSLFDGDRLNIIVSTL